MSTDILDIESEDTDGDYESLSLISTAEINQQISTAKKFPRNIKKFLSETTSLATENEEIAGECFYRLKRKDKDGKDVVIEGPSSRLAEIVTLAWGNSRSGARIVEEGDRFVTAQGVFHDLERNVAVSYETRRRITTKSGKRFGDDMIGVTCAAAASIALRNAVFKAIPKALWLGALEAAKKTYRGEASSLSKKRSDWKAYWAKVGVSDDRLLAKLGKPNWEAVDLDDCLDMRGMATALKEGGTTLDECFPAPTSEVNGDAGRSKADQVAEQLARQKSNGNGHGSKPAETNGHANETKAAPSETKSAETETKPVDTKPEEPTRTREPGDDDEPISMPTADTLKAALNSRIAGKTTAQSLREISAFNKEVEQGVIDGQISKDTQMQLLNYGLQLKSKLGK